MEGFSAAEGDLHLHEIAFEIDLGGNEGEPFFLDLALQTLDFLLVDEKAAVAFGDMVEDRALVVGLDGEADEPHLAVLDAHVGIGEGEASCPERFDFGSLQGHAGLEVLYDLVVEVGFLVRLEGLYLRLLLFHHYNSIIKSVPDDPESHVRAAEVPCSGSYGISVDRAGCIHIGSALDDHIVPDAVTVHDPVGSLDLETGDYA